MKMPARVREWWIAGTLAGIVYGVMLMQATMALPAGSSATVQIVFQPVWKAAMTLLLCYSFADSTLRVYGKSALEAKS